MSHHRLWFVMVTFALLNAACVTSSGEWIPSSLLQDPEAASPVEQEPDVEASEDGEEEFLNRASVFVGDTIIDGDHAFSIGLDYERRLHELIGIGAMVDFAFDGVARDEIVALAAYLHPIEKVAIVVAPGVEQADGEDNFLFRLGATYEIPVGTRYSIAPTAYFDFLESGEEAVVIGVAFGIGF